MAKVFHLSGRYSVAPCIRQKSAFTYIKNDDTITTAIATLNKLILTHHPHAHLYVYLLN